MCVNSSEWKPNEEFGMTKGLRQGDPMTPFSLLMVVEGLSGLMRQAVEKKLFSGFKVWCDKVEVDMLQFADDTIFFFRR